jgi:dimethylhistidine N-methyltransferase
MSSRVQRQPEAEGEGLPNHALPANVVFTDLHPRARDKRAEILGGLMQEQKYIDPKYFYDARGSALFEQITGLPEYYPTRTERHILQRNARAMAATCGPDCVLVEPGSGSSEKVRLLLGALKPAAYVPMDISADFLERSAIQLAEEYPWLQVHAVCTDFASLEKLPPGLPANHYVIFYPGSTLGNMRPADAVEFLRRLGRWLDRDGGILIGIDLHKSARILEAAYNDAQGITAQFNLNILNHVNTLTSANFDPDRFSHRAFYNEEKQRVEMHLVSKQDQVVHIGDTPIRFTRGETIHTENSYKYTRESFRKVAASAGFEIHSSWCDDQRLFSVHYLGLRGDSGKKDSKRP